MTLEEILKLMEKGLGEETKPIVLMSKLIQEWIPRQGEERHQVCSWFLAEFFERAMLEP